jgi:hypothetical protein
MFEFRVGGHWAFTMHGPDPDRRSKNPGGPREFPNHIVWMRLERSTRPSEPGSAPLPWYLEFDHVRADRIDTPLFTAAVIFEDRGGDTLLTWRAAFGSHTVRDQIIRDYLSMNVPDVILYFFRKPQTREGVMVGVLVVVVLVLLIVFLAKRI